MIVVAEVGEVGTHTAIVGDRAFLRSVEQIVHLAAPGVAVEPGLTAAAPGAAHERSAAAREIPAAVTQAQVGPPPKTSFVPVLGSTAGAGDNIALLRCHDPAVSTCYPQMLWSATTAPAYGAWYRTFAVNRDPARAVATFTASVAAGTTWNIVSSEPLAAGQWGELQVLSVTQDWMRSSVASPTPATPVGISSLVASVAPRAQERYNWSSPARIDGDDQLHWFRHDGRTDGSWSWGYPSGNLVGTGWNYKDVFSAVRIQARPPILKGAWRAARPVARTFRAWRPPRRCRPRRALPSTDRARS